MREVEKEVPREVSSADSRSSNRAWALLNAQPAPQEAPNCRGRHRGLCDHDTLPVEVLRPLRYDAYCTTPDLGHRQHSQ